MRLSNAQALLAAALLAAATAFGQSWSPEKNIEILVGSAPGGSNDKMARQIERILLEQKLVNRSITIVNRSGGGGSIALHTLSQRPGDAHSVIVFTPTMLANNIIGASKYHYSHFTLIASLVNDFIAFVVHPDSPIKTGKQLAAQLAKDPQSLTVGFASALGSHNHIAIGQLMHAMGKNPRDLKVVAYKGSALAVTSLMGGHIDVVTIGAGNVAAHVAEGRLRVVAISAPNRFEGGMARIPTWKEQGVDLVVGGWRAIVGPRDLTEAQVAYWDRVLRQATRVPEWQDGLRANHWTDEYISGRAVQEHFKREYDDMKAVLLALGLAK
jgi:putative tricarboxylic transport membrane protein